MAVPASSLVIDEGARTVILDGVALTLTPTEYMLLIYLVDRAGRAVPDQELLAVIWGDGWVNSTSVLQVHISRLRRKLRSDSPSWRFVTRVRNFGYRFDQEAQPISEDQPWHLTLTYDADLILRTVSPHEPFLGWNPDDIIGTPFMLAGISHADAKGIANALLASGQLLTRQAVAARGAHGQVVPANVHLVLTTTAFGALAGMTGQVRFVTPT